MRLIDPDGLSATVFPYVEPIIRPMPMSPVDPIIVPNTPDVPNGPIKDPNGEYCRSLARKIASTKDEIYNKRYPDLEKNPESLPRRIGPGEALRDTIRGHEKLLNRRLRELRKLEDEYAKFCLTMCKAE